MSARLPAAWSPVPAPVGPAVPALPVLTESPVDPGAHVKWARAIARGVRADLRFAAGSDEEQELEGAAYLELCRAAQRFHLGLAYRLGALPRMRAAAHGYRRGDVPPCGARALGSVVVVAGLLDATDWVASKSRRLAKDRKRPAAARAAAELAARAALAFAAAFDLAGAFRGFAAGAVRAKCRQEAVRLRNGGTFHRARPELARGVSVHGLPADTDADAEKVVGGIGGGAVGYGRHERPLTAADQARHRDRRQALHASDQALGGAPRARLDDEDEDWSPCVTTWDE